jgi:selenocysteine lyase/cysteine desulfurase
MDWELLRNEFPVTRHWVYLDHAAVAPLSAPARQVLVDWSLDREAHGHVHEPQWMQRIEEVRKLAAQFINASDPDEIAFIKNTSEGIGIVAEGFPWQAGDNVVIAADEYPANVYPWMNLSGRGVEVRTVPGRAGRILVEDIASVLDQRTRILSLSHVEFATGFRNDLAAVGQLCRQRGVLFFVDAIQSVGVLAVDVRSTGVDFLAADGHKWMLGPEAAGIFFIRKELVERLHPVGIGWNSVVASRNFAQLDFRLKPNAGRWESGTLNVGGIAALGASLDLLSRIGAAAVEGRVFELTNHLCERAARLGLEVYSSRLPGEQSAIVSLVKPGAAPLSLVRRCRAGGIVINQRAGRIRISPHCYNTTDEIERTLELIAAKDIAV